jgi:peptidoglycan/xylan/chitin deacetylase (PgdA/CDA1 family)
MNNEIFKKVKPQIIRLAHSIGFLDTQRVLMRNRINIIMYHRFSIKTEPFKLEGYNFEKQVRFFKNKYNPIHLSTLVEAIEGKLKLPPNSVILTIDDGYEDNYSVAYPILKKHNVPATIFLATDFIDQQKWLWPVKLLFILQNTPMKKFRLSIGGQDDKLFDVETFKQWHRTQLTIFHHIRQLDDNQKNAFLVDLSKQLDIDVPEKSCGDFLPMTWDKIREMTNNGIEFGSHTCTHPILSRQNGSALEHETVDSKNMIENRLQKPVISFCYPNGQAEDFNPNVVQAVQKAGYKCAVTTLPGTNTIKEIQPFEIRRKGLMLTESHEISWSLLRK